MTGTPSKPPEKEPLQAEPPKPPQEETPPLPGFLQRKLNKLSDPETNMWALASSVGFSLVLAIFLGLALGYWLDGKLGTSPWLTLAGLLLGVAAGFKNLFVIAAKIEKKSRKAGPGKFRPLPPDKDEEKDDWDDKWNDKND